MDTDKPLIYMLVNNLFVPDSAYHVRSTLGEVTAFPTDWEKRVKGPFLYTLAGVISLANTVLYALMAAGGFITACGDFTHKERWVTAANEWTNILRSLIGTIALPLIGLFGIILPKVFFPEIKNGSNLKLQVSQAPAAPQSLPAPPHVTATATQNLPTAPHVTATATPSQV